ncbi:MAG: GIY-YIG nuclease family protein [Candidatus Pacebacteria bacterium]|nr:GIY-YIG nuclease family protein [Candidatus Paceibacterota bacterium]
MYYVYLLQDAVGKSYVGYSHDLKRRLNEHERGMVDTTSVYKKSKLIWYCAFASKKKALDFEKYLKAGSGCAFAKRHFV